jgi:hypothetical protein
MMPTLPELLFVSSPDGELVAECELDLPAADHGPPDLAGRDLIAGLVAAATNGGAGLLWVHSDADLTAAGFVCRQGYRRLHADTIPVGTPLPLLDPTTVLSLWPRAFCGQWGHHRFDPAADVIPPGWHFVGLAEGSGWAGLCSFDTGMRGIDGPGFLPGAASPDRKRALVLAACAHLGTGPATLQTWGDEAEVYTGLGFAVIEETRGWELRLPLVG